MRVRRSADEGDKDIMIFELIFSLKALYLLLTIILGYSIWHYASIFLERLQGSQKLEEEEVAGEE